MADTKLTALGALSPILSTDLLYCVSDPGGTPASKSVTVLQLLTAPRITTSLKDTNGNPLLAITATASAVYGLTLANAALLGTVAIGVTAPTQVSASVAGTPLSITAQAAVAGNVTAGAAAGGAITITSGAAARFTSGNANGGNINLTCGAGIGTGTQGSVVVNALALSNPGTGSNSERFGAGATSSTFADLVVIGNGAIAGADNVTVVGRGASATSSSNVVIGKSASDGGFSACLAIGFGSVCTTANQAVLGAPLTNGIFEWCLNRPDRSVPYSDVIVRGTDGTGTDIGATNQFYGAGASTGTAAGGDTGFKTAPSGASGTTVNTRLDRLRVRAQGTALVDNTATSIFEVALPTLQGAGGILFATIRVSDGTDMQEFSQVIQWSAVNKGGSYTTNIAPVPMDLINLVGSKSVSAGTITTTWSILNGTNKVTIQVAADTSLTPSGTNSFVCYWVLINNSQQAITPD